MELRQHEFTQAESNGSTYSRMRHTRLAGAERAEMQSKDQAATGGEQLSSQAVSELPLNKRDFATMELANGASVKAACTLVSDNYFSGLLAHKQSPSAKHREL